ncbi:acetyl-CoA synthetase-like protein [Tilletiopsis washingtonensis]|uniref:Acetyl-CoA synthetase-like protein n=1 Tax=Tilletiopsis washingtonensis TaxID=58919 RepID=A0A316Z062_9BASI|nr:acetyl-CoA synthetase-like protein [Tilletiopsis washingtonensis]PWN94676.1 acetyl-CoA synthetase-like protein [Tilletiopsis washingtonensis]
MGDDREKHVFRSAVPSHAPYPDDLDVYSFIFEHFPASRPDPRGRTQPLLVDDETGEGWTFEECKQRTDALSVGLREKCGVSWDTVAALYSSNSVYYPIVLWAVHRLGGVISAANPAFQPDELAYQLDASKASVLLVGYEARAAGFKAADRAGISRDKVVIVCDPAVVRQHKGQEKIEGSWTVTGLIAAGEAAIRADSKALDRQRRALAKGEGRKKLSFLSFSSGTTGLPKGVAIPHSSPIANVLQMASFNEVAAKFGEKEGRFRPGVDVSLGLLPFYHIYGLVIVLHFTFYIGVTTVVVPRFKGIVPMLESCVKYKISIWWLVPPQVVLLCKDPGAKKYHAELAKFVRFVMIGAAPLSDDLSRQLDAILPGLHGQGYGMTETCTVTLMHPLNTKPVMGSAGRLVTDTDALVVTTDGNVCGVEERGELWIRAPQNTLGYFNNKQATEEMFLKGNWVRTGDEVYFNKDGDCFITDRLKELIKVKGFQVAPAELEGWILNHADVRDCGVIGYPDEDAGEVPCAFIALSEDAKARVEKNQGEIEKIKASVAKHVSDTKVHYKRLGRVEILDSIPATASGKILRRTLRDIGKTLPPIAKPQKSRL